MKAGLAFAILRMKEKETLHVMNLLLAFFLSGLFLHGIKTIINYLINRASNFNEVALAPSHEDHYDNQILASSIQQPDYVVNASSRVAGAHEQLTFVKVDQSRQHYLPVKEAFFQGVLNKQA